MNIFPFVKFLNDSPTSWHAVENVSSMLASHGFQPLQESADWVKLTPGGKYFTTRNGSSLIAFILPLEQIKKTVLLGSHTDSPSLKLKPRPLYLKDGVVLLAVEVYGAPLLTSWFNRDLGIAGRIVVEGKQGKPETRNINVKDSPVTLAQLAIHLDREVNEKGFVVDKQEALNAIAGLSSTLPTLEQLLQVKEPIISHDLFLYPLEEACLVGFEEKLLSGYRIDNLTSVSASVEALSQKSAAKDTLQMIALWDHEEIGSPSHFAAGSPFLASVLERLVGSRELYHQMISRSICLSVDLTHATHPNFSDKHESHHPIRLGGGVVVKYNSGFRYATDAEGAANLIHLAKKKGLSLQHFVTHGNIMAGSTIGPIHAGATGMSTIDIGIPQLSMHSCRELIATADYFHLLKLLDIFLDEHS